MTEVARDPTESVAQEAVKPWANPKTYRAGSVVTRSVVRRQIDHLPQPSTLVRNAISKARQHHQ